MVEESQYKLPPKNKGKPIKGDLNSVLATQGGHILGKVRPKKVKAIARELVMKYADQFAQDFDKNKEVAKLLTNITAKRLLNQVAGYVTRIMRSQIMQRRLVASAQLTAALEGRELPEKLSAIGAVASAPAAEETSEEQSESSSG